jgi:hypothetical protein
VLLVAACSAPARPPEPEHVMHAQPRACVAIAPTCDRAIGDTEAFAVVQHRCLGCHGEHGIAGHDFTAVSALPVAAIGEMIGSCQMPPDGEPALAEPERRLLVAWAACRADHD